MYDAEGFEVGIPAWMAKDALYDDNILVDLPVPGMQRHCGIIGHTTSLHCHPPCPPVVSSSFSWSYTRHVVSSSCSSPGYPPIRSLSSLLASHR